MFSKCLFCKKKYEFLWKTRIFSITDRAFAGESQAVCRKALSLSNTNNIFLLKMWTRQSWINYCVDSLLYEGFGRGGTILMEPTNTLRPKIVSTIHIFQTGVSISIQGCVLVLRVFWSTSFPPVQESCRLFFCCIQYMHIPRFPTWFFRHAPLV